MTEQFDPKKVAKWDRWKGGTDGKSLFFHLLIAATARVAKKDGDRIIELWHKGDCQIEFKFNGVDVPILAICEDWDKQLDDMLAKKAYEFVEQEFGKLSEIVHDCEVKLRRALLDRIEKKLGIKLTEED